MGTEMQDLAEMGWIPLGKYMFKFDNRHRETMCLVIMTSERSRQVKSPWRHHY